MVDLKDSGEHAVEHALFREHVKNNSAIATKIELSLAALSETVGGLRLDLAEIRSDLTHAASREDVSKIVAECRATRPSIGALTQATTLNWRAIGAAIAVVIGAIAACVVTILQAI